jgi:hypothetical protein
VLAVRGELPQQRLHDLLADRILAGGWRSVGKQQGTDPGGELSVRRKIGWNFFGRESLLRRSDVRPEYTQQRDKK